MSCKRWCHLIPIKHYGSIGPLCSQTMHDPGAEPEPFTQKTPLSADNATRSLPHKHITLRCSSPLFWSRLCKLGSSMSMITRVIEAWLCQHMFIIFPWAGWVGRRPCCRTPLQVLRFSRTIQRNSRQPRVVKLQQDIRETAGSLRICYKPRFAALSNNMRLRAIPTRNRTSRLRV